MISEHTYSFGVGLQLFTCDFLGVLANSLSGEASDRDRRLLRKFCNHRLLAENVVLGKSERCSVAKRTTSLVINMQSVHKHRQKAGEPHINLILGALFICKEYKSSYIKLNASLVQFKNHLQVRHFESH